ncbi:unnamed protein product [Cylicostephanus goldi]|uniref:Uncharacterized protein n=1 Tax=Cylicostephanus goldi TaxID=71465 RepID=A0A3P7P7Y4_CYLGO|nr:unnamed protein product [Cylicostephanus goldi]
MKEGQGGKEKAKEKMTLPCKANAKTVSSKIQEGSLAMNRSTKSKKKGRSVETKKYFGSRRTNAKVDGKANTIRPDETYECKWSKSCKKGIRKRSPCRSNELVRLCDKAERRQKAVKVEKASREEGHSFEEERPVAFISPRSAAALEEVGLKCGALTGGAVSFSQLKQALRD